MKPSDKQVGGSHYKDFAMQPAEFIHMNKIGFLEGNVIKYVCRHAAKNGRDDLLKARHYIDLLLEWQYDGQADGTFPVVESSADQTYVLPMQDEYPEPGFLPDHTPKPLNPCAHNAGFVDGYCTDCDRYILCKLHGLTICKVCKWPS